MSASAPVPGSAAEAAAGIAKLWWLFLITGVAWLGVAFILFQYDAASLATVGYLVGFMLVFTGIEQFMVASAVEGWKWAWILFGILFVVGGMWVVFNPLASAFALATSLGVLFVLIGLLWIIEAVATRSANPLWWLGLVSGLLMVGLAWWVSQQNTLEKILTLLTFAAIWALMHGIGDFIRAFQLRRLGKLVAQGAPA
ncbi:MAG: DUF308 domain-containing protein [Candidatus Nanopelagicales bacterium]|jgi:uncharacterized membrane protein HdeD (DUF308 family)|nr:DUF308 domain-containing protein [Candidatus Nanopelagicales bacterium]